MSWKNLNLNFCYNRREFKFEFVLYTIFLCIRLHKKSRNVEFEPFLGAIGALSLSVSIVSYLMCILERN